MAVHAYHQSHPSQEKRYEQRRPEKTVLYQIVREHLETFLAEGRAHTEHRYGYPQYIEKAFREYLECGILAYGFARIVCESCKKEMVLPFSCKGRGLCPSCHARRMSETAVVLVDTLLPIAPYRQWVLSLPWEIRLQVARNDKRLSGILRIFIRAIFSWQKKIAGQNGITHSKCGAITFVQYFGAALNINPHFHVLVPDGVFTQSENHTLTFHTLPAPSYEDIISIATKVAPRTHGLIQKTTPDFADFGDEDNALMPALHEAIQVPWMPLSLAEFQKVSHLSKKRCANVSGFSIHAGTHVSAHNRNALEKLIRYGLRSCFTLERLSILPNGKVSYTLKKPWPNPHTGMTHLIMEPLKFLRRLALLIPPPRKHLTRYHGIFAPNSHNRNYLPSMIPRPKETPSCKVNQNETHTDDSVKMKINDNDTPKPKRMKWAALIKRIWKTDVMVCPHCNGKRKIIAFIQNPDAIQKILTHSGLSTDVLKILPARAPPQTEFGFEVV